MPRGAVHRLHRPVLSFLTVLSDSASAVRNGEMSMIGPRCCPSFTSCDSVPNSFRSVCRFTRLDRTGTGVWALIRKPSAR
jgi:hypothetical protein